MRYRIPDHLAWVDGDEVGVTAGTYLVDVRHGTPLVLHGSAHLIWSVVADGGDVPDDLPIPDDADPATVQAQALGFVAHLVSRGLLQDDT